MTDKEIIAALVHRADYDCNRCCDKGENCEGEDCEKIIGKSILDIINRQKAEIDRLKGWENLLKAKARAEAIKEFAVRVKMEVKFIELYYKLDKNKIVVEFENEFFAVIERIEKEMTEGENG